MWLEEAKRLEARQRRGSRERRRREHEHDLKSPGGTQHYAIIDDVVPANEQGSINQPLNISQGSQTTSGIPSSGGIREGGIDGQGSFRGAENLGEALDTLPPFVTINYIIFADNV